MSIAGEVQTSIPLPLELFQKFIQLVAGPFPKSEQQLLLISNEASTAADFSLPELDKLQGQLPTQNFHLSAQSAFTNNIFLQKVLAHSNSLLLCLTSSGSRCHSRSFRSALSLCLPKELFLHLSIYGYIYRAAKMSFSPTPKNYTKLGQLLVYFIITCLLSANSRLLQVQVLGNHVGAHRHVLRPEGKLIKNKYVINKIIFVGAHGYVLRRGGKSLVNHNLAICTFKKLLSTTRQRLPP